MYEVESAKTGLEVKTGFFPMAFFLFACTPVIVIDGEENKRKWGTHFFDLKEGDHTIKIFFKYLFWDQCGANTITVRIEKGRVTRIKFYMPPLVTMKGFLKELKTP